MSDQRWVEWVEPFGPNNEPVYLRVPVSTAILVAQESAQKTEHVYDNDEQALEDFMTVHWAKIITK